MPVARAKGAKGKCDAIYSKIIRSVAHCEHCGSTDFLQCAHVVSRRYSATRTDLSNAFCLCAGCHRRFTDWPLEFNKFVEKKIGLEAYEELKHKAESFKGTMDWDTELERLKIIAKERGIK